MKCLYESNGIIRWYDKESRLHREDGPAIEWPDGSRFWYLDGNLHREAGPAIEYPSGAKAWYLNGVRYTEQEYYRQLVKRKIKTLEEVFLLML